MDTPTFIYGNKPYGVTTHQSDPSRPGYKEWLSHSLSQTLFVCHRLDRETTGTMIFATTPESATRLTEAFNNKQVQKEYIFVTDHKPRESSWTCTQSLENNKTGEQQVAVTHFQVLNEEHGYYTIAAQPLTGRTHQIRKHAALSKIPLLGDVDYGGSDYPTFFLHCQKMTIAALNISHETRAPRIFSNLQLLDNPLLAYWLMSVDRRDRLYSTPMQTLRLIHDEDTPLRLDLLGGKGCAGWWSAKPPTGEELQSIHTLMDLLQISEWRLMHYTGLRNRDAALVNKLGSDVWTGYENSLHLEFRNESGLSCGLFLDQRDNRQWLKDISRDKRVLNLFAYTGAFSVAAALGGAQKVTTVDLSKNYVEWSKRNFELNNITIKNHAFHAMDSIDYLKYARKKELLFDIIVCDPPSFSRDKKGQVFRVEKDFPQLLGAACQVLAPGGILLFSNNYEKWTTAKWLSHLRSELANKDIEITEQLNFGWDFETSHHRHMKAFLLEKK